MISMSRNVELFKATHGSLDVDRRREIFRENIQVEALDPLGYR